MNFKELVIDIYNEWILLNNLELSSRDKVACMQYCINKIIQSTMHGKYDFQYIDMHITKDGYLKIKVTTKLFPKLFKISPTINLNNKNKIIDFFNWVESSLKKINQGEEIPF